MPDSADVRDLETLRGLEADLCRFAARIDAALAAVEAEIRHTRDELAERTTGREDAVQRCEAELEAARQALAEAGPHEREAARETVREARAALAAAREDLALTEGWQQRTEEAVAGFRHHQRELLELATTLTDRAAAFLQGRHGELEHYVHIAGAGPGAGLAPGRISSGAATAGSPAAPLAPAAGPGPTAPVQTLGTPERDGRYLHRQSTENCEVVAEQGILHKWTGTAYDEAELTGIAADEGWWTEAGGTKMKDMGKLLDRYGVTVKRWEPFEANMAALQRELEQGHGVIVFVHAGIWYNVDYEGGHALWVTGMELQDGKPVRVWVNDSNCDAPEAHDADHFQRAWEGLQVYGLSPMPMCSTLDAAPERGE